MPVTISRTQLVIATLAIVALAFGVLTWSQGAPAGTQAANTGAKTQMDIVITGTFGPTAVICDSGAGDTKCTLETGSAFTVQIVPSTIPVTGYAGWQTLLNYGSLLYKPAPSAAGAISRDAWMSMWRGAGGIRERREPERVGCHDLRVLERKLDQYRFGRGRRHAVVAV